MSETITSASGLISLLDEGQPELQVYALTQLNAIIDQFWAEISESIAKIEILYEDENFEQRELAALIASKVYYHLGEYEDSLNFALYSGELFNYRERTEYVQTILSKAVDRYIVQNKAKEDIDPLLVDIVERLFERCLSDGEYKQAIGIAFESHRLDIIAKSIRLGDTIHLLNYVLDVSLKLVDDSEFRLKVMQLIKDIYLTQSTPDYIQIVKCNIHLNDIAHCFTILRKLVVSQEDNANYLTALQICFDIESSAPQKFKRELLDFFTTDVPDTEDNRLMQLASILNGERPIRLYIEFLSRCNNTDFAVLKNTRSCLDSRNSLYHSAVSFANAFMNAGTTNDTFLRQNLEWLSRASNWSKFSATAALGVIHKGNIANAKTILDPYLPNPSNPGTGGSSAYSEGGSLFAMGLIHANHHTHQVDFVLEAMQNTQDEIIQHGAALGLGVSAMATDNEDYYNELKKILYTDSAVAGEAAGISMGLIKLGTAHMPAIEEMLRYAQETQHEKIIRGLGIGIALIMFATEEKADELIERLLKDQDHIIRYGAMYTIAMAYCGTGSNVAIRKLLHIAVSDVNDDVRRAAVTALGFIMFKDPKQVPRAVQLLSESYNPHVRYGATIALGISCAGTGLMEAIEILEPMTKDTSDFVRQGAFIALAMILCQHNDASNSQVGAIRKLLENIISDKHEDPMAKFGATLAQGIIDCGGRNCTISLQNHMGLTNMASVAGMAIFTQFWYWFPYTHFMSLCFSPTTFIGVNEHLKVPKFSFVSQARPSLFAYPPLYKAPPVAVAEKIATAVLSTSTKSKLRAKKKKEQAEQEATAVEHDGEGIAQPDASGEKIDIEGETEVEPEFEMVENMQRVLPEQLRYLEFPENCRYRPIKVDRVHGAGGIVVLKDYHPDSTEEYLFPDIDEENESVRDQEENLSTKETDPLLSRSERGSQEPGEGPPSGFAFQFD